MICVPLEGLSETDKFPSTIKSQTVTLIQKPVCTHVQDFLCTDTSGETHQHNITQHYTITISEIGMMLENVKTFFPRPIGKRFLEIFLVPLGKVNSKFS